MVVGNNRSKRPTTERKNRTCLLITRAQSSLKVQKTKLVYLLTSTAALRKKNNNKKLVNCDKKEVNDGKRISTSRQVAKLKLSTTIMATGWAKMERGMKD